MSKSKMLKVLINILIVLLFGGCLYFYNLYRETEVKLNNTTTGVEINIGKLVEHDAVSFNIVTSPEDRNIIISALIYAVTADKPEITTKTPDAQIRISNDVMKNGGMIYYTINIWQDNDKVIFDLGDGYEKRYKELSTNSRHILDVISKYITRN